MAKVKLIIIRGFSTYDATGVVAGAVDDVIEVGAGTAKDLIERGFAKKYRPKKKEVKGE